MRFKLDENLHADLKDLLVEAGHDASTVYQEGLQGAGDPEVWAVCCREARTLLTQDMDFSDKRRYPVNETPGLVILRGHNDTSVPMQRLLMQRAVRALANHSPLGRRWIVEPASIRTDA